MHQARYVFLDRDGVINQDSDAYIKSAEEWKPIPKSLEAIARLKKNGFNIIVITNQSGLGRGLFDLDALDQMHQKMRLMIEQKGGSVDGIYFCPHRPDEGCDCRKPRPGLLERFSRENNISLEGLPFVGDSMKDILAAQAVNASPLLVKTGKGRETLADHPGLITPVFENLYEASEFIISG